MGRAMVVGVDCNRADVKMFPSMGPPRAVEAKGAEGYESPMSKLSSPASRRSVPSATDVTHDLVASLQQTADEVVPWFTENMPLAYFQDTDHAERLVHLRAILSAKASGRPISLTLRNKQGTSWTSMRPKDGPGVLAQIVSELPHEPPLRTAKIHTAKDGSLVLDTFEFGQSDPFDPADPGLQDKLARIIAWAEENNQSHTAEEIREHFHRCGREYLATVTPLRFCQHFDLFKEVTGSDGSAVQLERESDPKYSRIVVAVGNATTRRMLERIAKRLAYSRINIHRAYLDSISDGPTGSISVLGFVCQDEDGQPIEESSEFWKEVRRDLMRNKWIDKRTLGLMYRTPDLSLLQAEVVSGLCDLAHQRLVKQNSYAFNLARIHRLAERNLEQACRIADLFLARFDPSDAMSDDVFEATATTLLAEIENEVDLEDARVVLLTLLAGVRCTLRTNVYLPNRYGLGLRIDPSLLISDDRQDLPYGVFFVHGRGFNGFHVRFRDIARGGLRAVRTRSEEQHALEAERLYDEAYNLAFAQQLKNKDIPEGGAKAAVLLEPYARVDRAVKGFVDCLLDLISPDEHVTELVLDRFGKEELLYLGPDENITPEFIQWIAERAERRGYPLANAFMSSKPGAGINHKEYGVTSEGVNVFLDVTLQAIGIDPHAQPFTVKMTGGPDGDVGGNLINILDRDYGGNARVVGVADGSGSGEDPEGLDIKELVRLFHAGDPIASFDRSKLGPGGRIVTLDEPNGVMLRNTLHNRIKADAFVPCGGRPAVMHDRNWSDFLDADGHPTSRVIIEGANLFLTAVARRQLSEAGVLIMKDSSANKCGVITSSYEIISNMLVSTDDFLSIKTDFVEQVKEKLRSLARREAELLVRVHRHQPNISLPEMSIRLSKVMLRTAAAIEPGIDSMNDADQLLLKELVIEHLPEVLVEKTGEDEVFRKLPTPYLKSMMAKSLAARIVYREGFEYLEATPAESISAMAVDYLEVERERMHLADTLEASGVTDAARMAEILRTAGIFATLAGE